MHWIAQTVTLPGTPAFDCAGYYGGPCGDPAAPLAAQSAGDLGHAVERRPHGDVALCRPGDRRGGLAESPSEHAQFDAADGRLGARSYIDLSLAWRVNRHVEFRIGVNNLFDVDPPIIGTDFQAGIAANANTYPGAYDALGRWLFIAMTAKL